MARPRRAHPARTPKKEISPAARRSTWSWLAPALPVLAALAGVTLFLQREWSVAKMWGFSLDDSWIHAVFARNIASGGGYAFNPGEPVSGSTGPLYSLVLAGAYALTREMVWTAKVLGIACHLVSVIQVYRAAKHLDAKHEWFPLVTAMMVAVSPLLLWASVSGMEISLYVALICSGLERYLAGKDVAATVFWGLGVWVRPDGLFLVVLSLLGPWRSLWKRAAVAAALVLAFFAFNAMLGGSIFPQTVAAKTHVAFDLRGRTWVLLREWGALWGIPFRHQDELEHPVLLLPFMVVGAALLARKRPVLALYTIGLPVAFSLFRADSSSHKRYILHVIPFGIILATWGMRWVVERVARVARVARLADPARREGTRSSRLAPAFLVLSAAVLVWQIAIASAKATTHGWNVQNINMMQRLLGVAAKQMTPPNAVIAASDIGAIRYFSDRKVVDLMGLVSKPRTLPQNLTYYRPDLMIIMVDWFAAYARRDSATKFFAFYDEDASHKYTPAIAVELSHNTICAGDQMIGFVRQRPGEPPPQIYYHRS